MSWFSVGYLLVLHYLNVILPSLLLQFQLLIVLDSTEFLGCVHFFSRFWSLLRFSHSGQTSDYFYTELALLKKAKTGEREGEGNLTKAISMKL